MSIRPPGEEAYRRTSRFAGCIPMRSPVACARGHREAAHSGALHDPPRLRREARRRLKGWPARETYTPGVAARSATHRPLQLPPGRTRGPRRPVGTRRDLSVGCVAPRGSEIPSPWDGPLGWRPARPVRTTPWRQTSLPIRRQRTVDNRVELQKNPKEDRANGGGLLVRICVSTSGTLGASNGGTPARSSRAPRQRTIRRRVHRGRGHHAPAPGPCTGRPDHLAGAGTELQVRGVQQSPMPNQ